MNTENLTINCLGASNTRILIDVDGVKRNDINYPTMLGELLNCRVRNYGVSGTNIAMQDGRADSYFERAGSMEGGADFIIIQGGGNDASHCLPLGAYDSEDPFTYCGALSGLIKKVRGAHPQSKIIVSTSMKKKREPQKRTDGLTHLDFHKAFVAVCKAEGVETIDFYNDPQLDPFDEASMPDGLHMSEKACLHMAQVFAEAIRALI